MNRDISFFAQKPHAEEIFTQNMKNPTGHPHLAANDALTLKAESSLEDLLNEAWQELKRKDLRAQALAQKLEQLARAKSDDLCLAHSQLILGVCALDSTRSEEAIERLTVALARFRWMADTEHEWYCLAAIAQAWYQLDDYEQMHETLILAKSIPNPTTATKFAWLDRVGMIR